MTRRMTLTTIVGKVKPMHHIFTYPLRNCFQLPTNNIFNLFPLSWLKKSSLWQKETYFEQKRFQNSSKGLALFQKKAILASLSNWNDFKSYLQNNLKTNLISKGVAKWIFKDKSFVSTLSSTKCFQTKDPLAQFVLKSFDFTLRAKSFSK